jgi:hypothetical protein
MDSLRTHLYEFSNRVYDGHCVAISLVLDRQIEESN